MKTSKVLTGYSGSTDAGIKVTSASVITGCTDNKAFTFITELTNLVLLDADYAMRLSKVASGTTQDMEIKNESKAKLKTGLKIICSEINRQHAGNTNILESSGAPLWANAYQKKGGDNPAPKKLRVVAGVAATELKAEIDVTVGFRDYGTVWAYTPVLDAVNDVNLWNKVFETGHRATIVGLIPATKYNIAAAHKGAKGTALVWGLPVVAYTKAG